MTFEQLENYLYNHDTVIKTITYPVGTSRVNFKKILYENGCTLVDIDGIEFVAYADRGGLIVLDADYMIIEDNTVTVHFSSIEDTELNILNGTISVQDREVVSRGILSTLGTGYNDLSTRPTELNNILEEFNQTIDSTLHPLVTLDGHQNKLVSWFNRDSVEAAQDKLNDLTNSFRPIFNYNKEGGHFAISTPFECSLVKGADFLRSAYRAYLSACGSQIANASCIISDDDLSYMYSNFRVEIERQMRDQSLSFDMPYFNCIIGTNLNEGSSDYGRTLIQFWLCDFVETTADFTPVTITPNTPNLLQFFADDVDDRIYYNRSCWTQLHTGYHAKCRAVFDYGQFTRFDWREIGQYDLLNVYSGGFVNNVTGYFSNVLANFATAISGLYLNNSLVASLGKYLESGLLLHTINLDDTSELTPVELVKVGLDMGSNLDQELDLESGLNTRLGLINTNGLINIPSLWQQLIDNTRDTLPPVPPTSTGDTPPIIVPVSGGGSKLYRVYNPSESDLDDLGAYLWNSSFIDDIKKFFNNNPMEAIISLHQIYHTPTTGSRHSIVLGGLTSTASAIIVTQRYNTIDCGSVSVPYEYNDARDYDYSNISVFLPFIGFRALNAIDVIGHSVNIKYTIDTYTGSCIAVITCSKDGATQALYQFEGMASAQIPLTSYDNSSVIGGIIGAVGSIIAGGPVGAMGAVGSLIAGASNQHVGRSGSFSGCAGAMAVKIPYLVISRQIPYEAVSRSRVSGMPTNVTTILRNCSGFVRVKDCHLDNINASDEEKDIIMGLLKEGVVI